MLYYRFARDLNPAWFVLERGYQIGSGKEMFSEEPVSRATAGIEFLIGIGIIKLIGSVFKTAAGEGKPAGLAEKPPAKTARRAVPEPETPARTGVSEIDAAEVGRYTEGVEHGGPEKTTIEKVNKKKPSIRWDQESQCWRDAKTGKRTKGPKMPKGFGKPSEWKEGTRDVAIEMIASKEGQKVYEKMRDSSIQDGFIGAFEEALKQVLENKK